MTSVCDPIDPPSIVSSGFNVNESIGTPDINGDGGASNPPVSDSVVEAFVITSGTVQSIIYEYFLDGVLIDSAGHPYTIVEDTGVPGKDLTCTVTVSNVAGSATVNILMGVVYGTEPEIPNDITTFALFDPPVGSIVFPNDSITITYNNSLTSSGDPDPDIITVINGGEYTGNSIVYTVTENELNCEVVLNNINVSNENGGIPGTGVDFKTFNYTVAGVQDIPGNPCGGDVLGSCCVTGDFDSASGITYGSCSQKTEAQCLELTPNGKWTSETNCPVCDGTVGTPCCNEIGTGRCCCIQNDNTGLCIPDVTAEECAVTDSRFTDCGNSSSVITWTYGEECPQCGGTPDPPCCAPFTGRCCEVVLQNSNGRPVGAHCESGLESFDCPQFQESDPTNFFWTPDGSCVTCADPVLNFGLPCCDPLGRCCLIKDNLRNITYNITDSDCEVQQTVDGWTSRVWTENTAGVPSEELECSIPFVAAANPECCPALGLCCFKTANGQGNDNIGFRLGQCHPNITELDCSILATAETALNSSWNSSATCPDCGSGNNNDLCCNDEAPQPGRCCSDGICIPDQVFDDCPNSWDGSSVVCPDCTDSNENPANDPSDCCASGVPLLSIDSFTVDGQLYDVSLNPIGVGSEVAVSTTELNVQGVSYRFYITDSQGGNPSIDLTNGNTKTLTVPETQAGISGYLPGYELNFEVTADSQLEPDVTLSDNIIFHDPKDYIHGIPPVFPGDVNDLYPAFSFALSGVLINPPIILSYDDAFLFPGTVISNDALLGIPPAAASYEWTDANDNFISDALFYTISSDGVVENCGLGLQVTLENNVVGPRVIPGGVEITEIYNIGSIQGPNDTFCGTPIGRCCVQGNFVEAGTLLSDGQQWGITFSSCSIKDEPTCIADGGEWDDDINDCSVCLTAPPSQGGPCCNEIPGRCCENNSCDDFVLFIDCGGTWTSYMDDTNVCEDACPDAGAACGCATTGACCCGSGFSTPCHDGYTEEDCENVNSAVCNIGNAGIFQGYGTSCPTDEECMNEIGAADCCPADEIEGSWTGRLGIGSTAVNTCRTINDSNLADVHRCDGVSREGGRSLQWTSPCDYREILSLPGLADTNPRCEIDSICSCYVAAPLNSNIPYCNGPNTGGRKHEFGEEPSLNLVALCEQKVCASDPFCCEEEWDFTCAKTAEQLCGADNIFSGEVDGDELTGAIAESKAVFRNYDNTCSAGPGNFTPCIGTPVYPDIGDYTLIRTWSDCRCNFLYLPATDEHANCLNGLL
jgi:hypothetical protein